jgi:hypothetical protein
MTGLTIGSRRQVWNGTAKKTSGGLTKSDLMMSHGRIVSKSKHFSAKKEMRLLKHGYGTKKGKFGYVKVGTRKHRGKKMKGGMRALSPGDANWQGDGISGAGITNFGQMGSAGLQIEAGMSGGRRRRHRRMRGGSGMKAMGSPGDAMWQGDGISGAGITSFGQMGSAGLQVEAGMSGGRRRRHRRSMAGGTTSPHSQYPLSPGSVGVQERAGAGN